jgi:hypothetical protein
MPDVVAVVTAVVAHPSNAHPHPDLHQDQVRLEYHCQLAEVANHGKD